MARAYCLYSYDEHGPQDMIVDTDPVRFRARAAAWLALYMGRSPVEDEAALAKLDVAIVGSPSRTNLYSGWGGPAVEAVEIP